jgi:hypothetical protein
MTFSESYLDSYSRLVHYLYRGCLVSGKIVEEVWFLENFFRLMSHFGLLNDRLCTLRKKQCDFVNLDVFFIYIHLKHCASFPGLYVSRSYVHRTALYTY